MALYGQSLSGLVQLFLSYLVAPWFWRTPKSQVLYIIQPQYQINSINIMKEEDKLEYESSIKIIIIIKN